MVLVIAITVFTSPVEKEAVGGRHLDCNEQGRIHHPARELTQRAPCHRRRQCSEPRGHRYLVHIWIKIRACPQDGRA